MTEIPKSSIRGSASDYHYYSGKQRELSGRDAAKYASRPRLQTNALSRLQGTAGQGQGSGATTSRLLCEECGDGQLAADATSPVVHHVCTAMSRERPEAALRSYGHFSWRRANDQHAHTTFPNHNPTSYTNGSIATPLLTSKRTWCDFCQTSSAGRLRARSPRLAKPQISKSVAIDHGIDQVQYRFNVHPPSLQAGRHNVCSLETPLCSLGGNS